MGGDQEVEHHQAQASQGTRSEQSPLPELDHSHLPVESETEFIWSFVAVSIELSVLSEWFVSFVVFAPSPLLALLALWVLEQMSAYLATCSGYSCAIDSQLMELELEGQTLCSSDG